MIQLRTRLRGIPALPTDPGKILDRGGCVNQRNRQAQTVGEGTTRSRIGSVLFSPTGRARLIHGPHGNREGAAPAVSRGAFLEFRKKIDGRESPEDQVVSPRPPR